MIFIHKKMLSSVAKRIAAKLNLNRVDRITAKYFCKKDDDHPFFEILNFSYRVLNRIGCRKQVSFPHLSYMEST